jgi:hypothetical protein
MCSPAPQDLRVARRGVPVHPCAVLATHPLQAPSLKGTTPRTAFFHNDLAMRHVPQPLLARNRCDAEAGASVQPGELALVDRSREERASVAILVNWDATYQRLCMARPIRKGNASRFVPDAATRALLPTARATTTSRLLNRAIPQPTSCPSPWLLQCYRHALRQQPEPQPPCRSARYVAQLP